MGTHVAVANPPCTGSTGNGTTGIHHHHGIPIYGDRPALLLWNLERPAATRSVPLGPPRSRIRCTRVKAGTVLARLDPESVTARRCDLVMLAVVHRSYPNMLHSERRPSGGSKP